MFVVGGQKGGSLVDITLTSVVGVSPSTGPTGSGIVEQAGATGQADGPDVVAVSDGAAELHQCNVVVEESVIVVGMDDDLTHGANYFVWVGTTLSLPSQVNGPSTGTESSFCSGTLKKKTFSF